WLARPHDEATTRLLRRLRFARLDIDLPAIVERAASGVRSLDAIDVAAHLAYDTTRALDTLAPARLQVPSGRSMPIDYGDDGSVAVSVKLQELFGLTETPVIGPRRTPVVFHLLAPNGRPVQTTRDLGSFWTRTYPEVRKELRGRYPKHPWPDDPWTAPATHRTSRQR
ncbi:MAG: ATP-dependent helicase HrpB, partial [Acidobacteria bacterium]|nr:ATP-dependent helicase HrpB [Acidobacteriota bacterium]